MSDFQRESLEPSSAYQTTATTISPEQLARATKTPIEDKRPIKNIITTSLTKQLHVPKAASSTAASAATNRTNAHVDASAFDENEVRTAPSYTFYAPQKILQRSGFVLQMSRDVLEYLQDWLNVKYPLTKLGESLDSTSTRDNRMSLLLSHRRFRCTAIIGS